MKGRIEITAESIRKAIDEAKPTSLAALAHGLGYKGSISSAITGRLRAILPDVDALVAACKPAKDGKASAAKGQDAKPAGAARPAAAKPKGGKWPRHPANGFREGSSYACCFDVLAAHPDGLPREKLIVLLAKATGKDEKHAAFDVQVVCSARKNDEGLNAFEGPRNRSCKLGFYVERQNSHVKLVLPAAGTAAKEQP
jgi:hypothetical protein